MDIEQNAWAIEQLKRKSDHDKRTMHNLFVKTYSQLLDSIIRKRIKTQCAGCIDDSIDKHPMCTLQTGYHVHKYGWLIFNWSG